MALPIFLLKRAGRAARFLIFFCLLAVMARAGERVGTGDGRIHIIPSLSAPSVKNGEKIRIGAVIKAEAGVAKVEAEILPENSQNNLADIDTMLARFADPLRALRAGDALVQL